MSAGSRQVDAGERVRKMELGTRGALKRRQVADIQRARIVSAMFEVCAKRGASNVTVAHVVAHAGVSRRTFYELFEDCESCLLMALDGAVAKMTARVMDAYGAGGPWRERIRVSLTALLRFLEEEPAMGRMLIVESYAAGPAGSERRARVLTHVIAAVDAGRGEMRGTSGPPPLAAEGLTGAVLFVIHRRLIEAKAPPMAELVNPLMSMIVLPYLGAAASRAELKRAVEAPERVHLPKRDTLTGLDIRLTYRTIRVLAAIGAQPGSSNREVGRAAGAADPGQISKLLTRLQRLGLIENRQDGGFKGTPNAWALTRKGAEVERAIAAHSGSLDG